MKVIENLLLNPLQKKLNKMNKFNYLNTSEESYTEGDMTHAMFLDGYTIETDLDLKLFTSIYG